jgi:hypothetical protein
MRKLLINTIALYIRYTQKELTKENKNLSNIIYLFSMIIFDEILEKYKKIILDQKIVALAELKNIIVRDDIFNTFDIHEKEVIMDILTESIDNLNKSIKKIDFIEEKTKISTQSNQPTNSPQMNKPAQSNLSEYGFGTKRNTKSVFSMATPTSEINGEKSVKSEPKITHQVEYTEYIKYNEQIEEKDNKIIKEPNFDLEFINSKTVDLKNVTDDGVLLSSITRAVICYIDNLLYLQRKKQFILLRNIYSPEQRSKRWFEQRNKSITASDCGCVLGENKYEPIYNFVYNYNFYI